MSWIEDSTTMAEQCQDAFAQPISYIDPSLAEAVTLDCPVSHEREERRVSPFGVDTVAVREVYVLNADQTLRIDGVFTIDSKSYAIEELHPRIGGRTRAKCRRVMAKERTRPRYRG